MRGRSGVYFLRVLMQRLLRSVLALVTLLPLTGCGRSDTHVAPPAPVVVANAAHNVAGSALPQPRVFRIARIPFRTAKAVFAESEGLFDSLAGPLGYDKVAVETARDYDSVMNLLSSGQVDAAWLGTVSYARARVDAARSGSKNAPVPVAVPIRDGHAFYDGAIIARTDSGFKSLKDLKGKRIAFVDPESASGFVFPRLLLEAAGVRVPDDLATETPGSPDFLHGHDSVVAAVYLKKFEAGAVYDAAVEAVFAHEPEKARDLTVLARTARIFNEPIVVRASASPEWRAKLQSALLSIKPVSHPDAHLTGFGAVSEDNYRELESMIARAK